MKKRMLMLATAAILVVFCTGLFAQTTSVGDTLIVGPLNSEGQPLGALNEAIHGDTTETGERVHKVYKLQPNAQYILTEVIQADFPLVIVADEPDDENRPPIVRCGLKEDGSAVDNWWHLFDDATFKNLWMSGVNLDGTGPIAWIAQTAHATQKTITFDGCIVEFPYTWWATFWDPGGPNNYIIKDCLFKNIGNPTGTTWNGAVFTDDGHDTVIVHNTTFYKFGCFAVKGAFYTEIDHCSFINSVVHPIDNHRHVNRKYTNNLFVNVHAFSDDEDEIKRHFDQEVKGIMNYAEIQWDPQELDSLWGPGGVYGKTYDPDGDGTLIPEEMNWQLKNNAWWYTQPIEDYWAAWDNVTANPWMNNYNQAMFESSDEEGTWTWSVMTYERDTNDVIIDSSEVTVEHEPFLYFNEENTWNVDPGVTNMNGTDELLATNSDNIRKEWAGEEVEPVKWHGVDNYLDFTWPVTFDLSYSNATLQTAGTDGLPLGDLNWWPEIYVDVEDKTVVSDFKLGANYPNPFNPTTTIDYQINQPGQVKLNVYNVLGEKVKTLVNENKIAGTYQVTWEGTNDMNVKVATGVYFYKLEMGDQVQIQKMMLVK
ncbi:MAG: T9SS type A sorting domain-containing protein [candidate division KSB1 bacterium]|nr:T9SS type A sorting domain-containing protein [candidate division KSB1 bacterium]